MTTGSQCPDNDIVLALLEGRLADDARAALLAHADECVSCRSTVVERLRGAIASGSSPAPAGVSRDPLPRSPTRTSRRSPTPVSAARR